MTRRVRRREHSENGDGDERERRGEEESDDVRVQRRSYLKLAGILVGTSGGIHWSSRRGRAASNGYGEGGYGEGGYGGSSDTAVAVSSESATNITESSGTLNGSLDDLGGASSADCYFEWRESGTSSWTVTSSQSLTSTGSFSEDITGLSSGTDYEFRALADASDGDSDVGTTKTFTTSSGNQAPTIDYYDVVEAGSPNPHAEITVDWNVGDADGDLAQVEIAVYDDSGGIVDSSSHSVSGSDATGTDTFTIKHADGKTFDVTLAVSDSAGNRTSATQSITE